MLRVVGKTSSRLIARCREHLGVNKKGKCIKGVSSSIRDHINYSRQSASIDNLCILDNVGNEIDLLSDQRLPILKDRPTKFLNNPVPF